MTRIRRPDKPQRQLRLESLECRLLPSFLALALYDTGPGPSAVATADLNGDGIPDLVTANAGGNSVSVLLGNGDGSFQPALTFPAGLGAAAVGVADLNGDGLPDLVTANSFEGTVSVLLGQGNGSFQAPIKLAAGVGVTTLGIADVNGDGRPDLLTANAAGGTVSVLLGNGDGTFQNPRTYVAGANVQSIAVADLNGDGNPDVAVVNRDGTVAKVFLGNGDGTFQAPVSYAAGTNDWSIAVGDVNGDGNPDLIVANNDLNGSGTVSVLRGNGDGTFQNAILFAAGVNPLAVAVGDFNRDGVPDLAVADYGGSDSGKPLGVSVLLGQGDGCFQLPVSYPTASPAQMLAVGDYNGDGRDDIALPTLSHDRVMVLLTDATGGFAVPSFYTLSGDPGAVTLGDFNGDGRPDVMTANSSAGTLSLLLGNGDGSFQAPRDYSFATYFTSLAVGDFNNDGNLDLVTTDPGGLTILLGNGDGTFRAPTRYGGNYTFVSVADLNADGALDLVAGTFNGGTVSVFLGNGNGSFRSATTYNAGTSPAKVVTADVNGDGRPDLVVLNAPRFGSGGGVSTLLGNGDGTFRAAVSTSLADIPDDLGVADFNGDGKPDLAVLDPSGLGSGAGLVETFAGNGDGTFQAPVLYRLDATPSALAVGDVNGDGKPDLVAVSDNYSNTLSILLGQGDGSFQAPQNYSLSIPTISSLVLGDVNGDGLPDVIAASPFHTVVVVLNAGGRPALLVEGRHPFSAFLANGVSDSDGDCPAPVLTNPSAGPQLVDPLPVSPTSAKHPEPHSSFKPRNARTDALESAPWETAAPTERVGEDG